MLTRSRLGRWWAHADTPRHLSTFMLQLAAYLLLLAVGVLGFVGDPSPNVAKLGPLPTLVWSALFVLGAGTSTACRLRGLLLLEATATRLMVIALAVWGGAILLGGSKGGSQSAVAFLALGMFLLAWSRSVVVYVAAQRKAAAREAQYNATAEIATARIHQLEVALRAATGQDPPPFPLELFGDVATGERRHG